MNDVELLVWAHKELESRGMSPLHGMMHGLRHIIYSYPEDKSSPELVSMNDLDDLFDRIETRNKKKYGRYV